MGSPGALHGANPTNVVIGFASYLLPLSVLEFYLHARRSPSTLARFAAAALVVSAALVAGMGAYGTARRWLR